ncbi:hypothetical protein, partial [Klebsiella variicola]|uniref:hypothetical protein n=1 Tax=Klebsiella variicola TaxID=244366 RepID=UPI001C70E39A
ICCVSLCFIFFLKKMPAYDFSDWNWSSDVCSLHYHRLADDEPAAGVDAPLTATPVVWITPPSIDFRRGLRL